MGLRSLFRTILNRDKFAARQQVMMETYIKTGDRVHAIDEKHVHAAAEVLESAYVMSEEVPHDQIVALAMSRTELHSFVCYMRQLNHTYRTQCEYIARNIKPASLPDGYRHEFKTSEEAAPVSPELYAQLTGKSAGDPSLRFARELPGESTGDVPLAEIQRRAGDAS